MKLRLSELRQAIREVKSEGTISDYLAYAKKRGSPAGASSVMASYFLDRGLEGEHELHRKLASEMSLSHEDVMRDIKRQQSEAGAKIKSHSSDTVTLRTTDGEEIQVGKKSAGLETGWAVIANPYWYYPEGHKLHDPHWRRKDGETVIGVEQGTSGAMKVADAYQELYAKWDEERASLRRQYPDFEFGIPETSGERKHREKWEQRQKEKREEEEMQVPEPGQEFPKQVGMGRGARLEELRQIIRNVITKES
jgi:hypothetical protein